MADIAVRRQPVRFCPGHELRAGSAWRRADGTGERLHVPAADLRDQRQLARRFGALMAAVPQETSATADPVSSASAHRCAQAVAAQRSGYALSREFYCDADLFEREVRQLIL